MDDRQLIEDLLSALEYHTEQTRPIEFSKVAIQAAREYLQKPTQQEPVAWEQFYPDIGKPQIAFNAEIIGYVAPQSKKQEPVAWQFMKGSNFRKRRPDDFDDLASDGLPYWKPLYTTPPQSTWAGLTEDDRVLIKHDANFNQFMTAGEYADRVQQLTEARLKDLNT